MKRIYLTFDVDWAIDEVLEVFYSMLRELEVAATINVTHETEWIDEWEKDTKIELGIHPNFNGLLCGGGGM